MIYENNSKLTKVFFTLNRCSERSICISWVTRHNLNRYLKSLNIFCSEMLSLVIPAAFIYSLSSSNILGRGGNKTRFLMCLQMKKSQSVKSGDLGERGNKRTDDGNPHQHGMHITNWVSLQFFFIITHTCTWILLNI